MKIHEFSLYETSFTLLSIRCRCAIDMIVGAMKWAYAGVFFLARWISIHRGCTPERVFQKGTGYRFFSFFKKKTLFFPFDFERPQT